MTQPIPDSIKALAQQGEAERQQGRYEAALSLFNEAIAQMPEYAWAMAHRAESYFGQQNYQQAVTDFSQAIRLKPDYIWALAHRGVAYRRLKQNEAALADFNRVLELQPDYPWVLIHRAQIYIPAKQYDAALTDINQAMALDPQVIPYAQGERALLLNYMGLYTKAIPMCEAAIAQDPADYIAWYSLVVAKAKQYGLDAARPLLAEATAAIEAAVNIDSERPLALYRLGGLAALQGDMTVAMDYLRQAQALHPEPTELARHDPVWEIKN